VSRRLRTIAGMAACCAALAGCGSDDEGDPIPGELSASMQQQLDNIQGQVDNGSVGACDDIFASDGTFRALQQELERLPQRVDADVSDALQESIDRLQQLVQQRCEEIASETETTPEVTTPEPEPEPETTPEQDNQDDGFVPPGQGGTPPGQDDGSGGVGAPGDGDE